MSDARLPHMLRLLFDVADAAREIPLADQPDRLRIALATLALAELHALDELLEGLPE